MMQLYDDFDDGTIAPPGSKNDFTDFGASILDTFVAGSDGVVEARKQKAEMNKAMEVQQVCGCECGCMSFLMLCVRDRKYFLILVFVRKRENIFFSRVCARMCMFVCVREKERQSD